MVYKLSSKLILQPKGIKMHYRFRFYFIMRYLFLITLLSSCTAYKHTETITTKFDTVIVTNERTIEKPVVTTEFVYCDSLNNPVVNNITYKTSGGSFKFETIKDSLINIVANIKPDTVRIKGEKETVIREVERGFNPQKIIWPLVILGICGVLIVGMLKLL